MLFTTGNKYWTTIRSWTIFSDCIEDLWFCRQNRKLLDHWSAFHFQLLKNFYICLNNLECNRSNDLLHLTKRHKLDLFSKEQIFGHNYFSALWFACHKSLAVKTFQIWFHLTNLTYLLPVVWKIKHSYRKLWKLKHLYCLYFGNKVIYPSYTYFPTNKKLYIFNNI